QTSNVIEFTLKPKSKDTLFDTLSLSFGNGVINNMRLVDSVGQRTDILFSGVKANQPVPASKFKFDIPKGADVIQE
ncbi:outer-membrane lipoprotein carrier protein LolA, partial [Pseudomonas poae]